MSFSLLPARFYVKVARLWSKSAGKVVDSSILGTRGWLGEK